MLLFRLICKLRIHVSKIVSFLFKKLNIFCYELEEINQSNFSNKKFKQSNFKSKNTLRDLNLIY